MTNATCAKYERNLDLKKVVNCQDAELGIKLKRGGRLKPFLVDEVVSCDLDALTANCGLFKKLDF